MTCACPKTGDFSGNMARKARFENRRPYAQAVIAGVAQLAEHLICNQAVAGSSPIASSVVVFDNFLAGFPSGQREQTVNLPGYALRRFESSSRHLERWFPLRVDG